MGYGAHEAFTGRVPRSRDGRRRAAVSAKRVRGTRTEKTLMG